MPTFALDATTLWVCSYTLYNFRTEDWCKAWSLKYQNLVFSWRMFSSYQLHHVIEHSSLNLGYIESSTLLDFIKVMEKTRVALFKEKYLNSIRGKWEIDVKGENEMKYEHGIERTRWEGFLNISLNEQIIQQTYGLKTLNYPPKVREMVSFKHD